MYRQFGLGHSLVVQLLEQLPNVQRCSCYQFQHHPPQKRLPWRTKVPLASRCFISWFLLLFHFVSTVFFTSLPGSHTHTHTHSHLHANVQTKTLLFPKVFFSLFILFLLPLFLLNLQRPQFNRTGSARTEGYSG